MWRLSQTSGYLYLRVTVIRIDVHPAGENLINMTRTPPTPVHVYHTYASYERSPYVVTFRADTIELDRFTAPEKKCSRLHLSARLSGRGTRLSFSPNTAIEAARLSQTSIDEQATRLTGLISPAYDQYVQYLFTGPTHRPLTDTGESYNLTGADLPTPLLDLPNRRSHTFHLNPVSGHQLLT
jgi:hypothetical protein